MINLSPSNMVDEGFANRNILENQLQRQENMYKNQSISIKCSILSHFEDKFHEILQMDGIRPSDITKSLDPEANRQNIFKAGEGAG